MEEKTEDRNSYKHLAESSVEKNILIMLGVGVLATLLWNSPVLLPVKLLVVMTHEAWHGFSALFFGANLDKIAINTQEFGETVISRIPNHTGFLITVSAGYLGEVLSGAVLLNRGLKGKYPRIGIFIVSALLLYTSLLFTEIGTTAFFTGSGWALFLFIFSLNPKSARAALIIIGTLFLWYSFFDIFDFAGDSVQNTDAGILARYFIQDGVFTGIKDVKSLSYFISIIWGLIMFSIVFIFLFPVFKREKVISMEETTDEPVKNEFFPGEITPEIQEWFLKNGIGLDGKPIPEEILEELKNADMVMQADSANTARPNDM